jgi:hypothetical protein
MVRNFGSRGYFVDEFHRLHEVAELEYAFNRAPLSHPS